MANVQLHVDYFMTNCKLLHNLQNRPARIITDKFDWNVSGINIVKDLGWLNVCQQRDYITCIH